MPATKEAFIRYRIIDRMLRNKYKTFPTMLHIIEEMEDKLGKTFSESTIQKDIKAMKEDELLGYKAPISYSKIHRGYFYEDSNFSITEIPLSEQDIASIEFAATVLQQFKDVKLFSEFGSAVDKIFNAVNFSTLLDEEDVQSAIQFEKVPHYKGSDWIGTLLNHIKNREVITIEYRKFEATTSNSRVLHPFLLKEYRNRWYLIGMTEADGAIKTFALDRLVTVAKAEINFRFHPNFSAHDYFKFAYGITTFEGKSEKVQLWVSPFSAGYVKTQPLHTTQKILKDNKEGLWIEIRVGITTELIMDILSFGSNIKVLSPKALQDQVLLKLRETLELY
jgi:predicted DNA-binding transcriptional regulator YafY